ncbi:hypothetical protein [Dokdonia sp.]|uniref:hypothetical protein n=1 Tax=Dokdonia sp. TaxID=2024995 RepID=UPI0032673C61
MIKIVIPFLLLILISCNNKKSVDDESIYDEKSVGEYDGRRHSIKVSKDTVEVNQMVQALVYLAAPYNVSSETKMVVFLERDGYSMVANKDSLDYLPKLGFHNLEYNVDNQKWTSDKFEYRLTSAIGKQFNAPGEHHLRGYILEYYEGDPLLDSVFDYSKTKKHFFEEKVYVTKPKVIDEIKW